MHPFREMERCCVNPTKGGLNFRPREKKVAIHAPSRDSGSVKKKDPDEFFLRLHFRVFVNYRIYVLLGTVPYHFCTGQMDLRLEESEREREKEEERRKIAKARDSGRSFEKEKKVR